VRGSPRDRLGSVVSRVGPRRSVGLPRPAGTARRSSSRPYRRCS
jgi:hypothetical protein